MTEPNTGSDLAAIRTTAVEDGDELILNGQKTFISNGINCDLLIVAARDPGVSEPYQAIDLFLVEAGTPGFEKGKKIKKIGWHSQDTAELYFTDCRIPQANRLGLKGTGFIMLMQKLQQERLMCAIAAVAGAENMLELTIKYTQGTHRLRQAHLQVPGQPVQDSGDGHRDQVGRTFLDKLIADHLEGRNVVTEVSMAKYWTTEMARRVADECLQLHGGYGYCEEYPIARAWRDVRVMSIFAGTNEIMKTIVAKMMGL